MTAEKIFLECVRAINRNVLIKRESSNDKEFHFQNWFKDRLTATGLHFEQAGRNSYPDFSIVQYTDGYELKGLAYPGRDANFDSNSQTPSGNHNGRSVYYVFGRYPKVPDGNTYPVLDLVVCHGSFLNADHEYVHKNKNVKGFGSYGDIMIRDRKMYVVPTPFHLVEGVAHNLTLILPEDAEVSEHLRLVGKLDRIEAPQLVIGYSFNLRTNDLIPEHMPNPSAGRIHKFCAWRDESSPADPVKMRQIKASELILETDSDE